MKKMRNAGNREEGTATGILRVDVLTREILTELIRERSEGCVSLFMPTHRAGSETKQDPIRFKNLLGEAERQLVSRGLRAPEARKVLEPAHGLLPDASFWAHQSDGLAVFLSPGTFRRYSFPIGFGELAFVSGRFHVKPLLPLLRGDGRFFVLALSKNEVRFLRCTRHSALRVEPDGAPRSLAEALQYDDFEKSIQLRTVAGRGTGAIFHGHGAEADVAKENLRRYLTMVDRGLKERLREERAPLVPAGVDYILSIYREVATYAALSDRDIEGNPDDLSDQELRTRAWDIVLPAFREPQEKAAALYRELVGTGKASGDIKVIVPASHHGRIDSLFVPLGVNRWGTFHPPTGAVHLHRKARAEDDELLDLAAVETFANGGAVYAVPPEEIPGGTLLAAVFRY